MRQAIASISTSKQKLWGLAVFSRMQTCRMPNGPGLPEYPDEAFNQRVKMILQGETEEVSLVQHLRALFIYDR
jgi:hypothetical protein